MRPKIAYDGFKPEQKLLVVTDKTGSNNSLEMWMTCRGLNFDNTVMTYTYMYSIYKYIYVYISAPTLSKILGTTNIQNKTVSHHVSVIQFLNSPSDYENNAHVTCDYLSMLGLKLIHFSKIDDSPILRV